MQDRDILRSSFSKELRAEAQQNGWGSTERVQWILDHLHEYIERWLGFAALSISPRSLIESDLFTVLDIAVDELESQINKSSNPEQGQRLRVVREALESLRAHGSTDEALTLKAAVGRLRNLSFEERDRTGRSRLR
jgi:hypothetical protein